jgi:hypothetical protein
LLIEFDIFTFHYSGVDRKNQHCALGRAKLNIREVKNHLVGNVGVLWAWAFVALLKPVGYLDFGVVVVYGVHLCV